MLHTHTRAPLSLSEKAELRTSALASRPMSRRTSKGVIRRSCVEARLFFTCCTNHPVSGFLQRIEPLIATVPLAPLPCVHVGGVRCTPTHPHTHSAGQRKKGGMTERHHHHQHQLIRMHTQHARGCAYMGTYTLHCRRTHQREVRMLLHTNSGARQPTSPLSF